MKTPDEINMNAENAFLLREAAKAHADGYSDHLTYGGKGDPAEERWIEALSAGADALALIQQLQAENAEKEQRIRQLERSYSFAADLADGLKAATVKQEQELYVSEERNRQLETQNAELSGKIGQLESQNRCFKENKESCEKRMIDLAQRVPRWISVEERLPETCKETRSFYHSVTVLASENGRIMIGYFTTSKDDGSFDFSGIDSHKHFYDFAKPSHWMPLPEPPAKEATP